MKTTHSLRNALFVFVAVGANSFLFATPQEAPSTPAEIAEFLKMDVAADSRMQNAKVDIELKGGVALLTGEVESLAQAERATARAISTEGVRSVVNQLVIRETLQSELANKAKATLRSQKILDARSVKVTASGDRLVLTGTVGTWDEKDLARELLTEIPGVVAIDNKLGVTFEGIRKDLQIEAQLRFMIQDDPLYDGLDLVATVDGGTAKLAGTVGSKGELDRLVRRSYVTGIVDVSISNLRIDPDLKMEALGDKEYTTQESVAALQQALEVDPRINDSAVKVAINEGVVTLRGTVPTVAAKDAAEACSRAIPGILRVENRLTVSREGNEGKTSTIAASAPTLTTR